MPAPPQAPAPAPARTPADRGGPASSSSSSRCSSSNSSSSSSRCSSSSSRRLRLGRPRVGRGGLTSGGATCLTLAVQRMLSSKVANNVADYGDP